MLFEGDGGLLFHIQELETLKRQGYRILICAMNDGGYGSEFHKLRADGIDDSLAVFGRPAFENIARGFGLRGHEIRDVSVIPKLFADFTAQGESEIWNIQISDQVTAPIDAPDRQARARQYVRISVRLAWLVACQVSRGYTRAMQLVLHPQQQRIGDGGEDEQHDRDGDHLLGLQELHGVDDQEAEPVLRREHLGQQHAEQRQGEADPQPATTSGSVAGNSTVTMVCHFDRCSVRADFR